MRGVPLAAMRFDFAKWEGAGNDFILTQARRFERAEDEQASVAALCDRRTGIGADGVIFLSPDGADRWRFDYVNADGSRSFCGNGSRAAFAHLRATGAVGDRAVLAACDGDHEVAWSTADGLPGVALGPVALPQPVPASEGVSAGEFVDTGSPHHLVWLADEAALRAADVVGEGRRVRHAPRYAAIRGTNVDFVSHTAAADVLRMRTYERGVEDETRACGTGATAAAIADHAARGGALERTVKMSGGDLKVTLTPPVEGRYEGVWLWGPAREAFRGSAVWPALLCIIAFAFSGLQPLRAQPEQLQQRPRMAITPQAQLSILTGSPGSEVYSSWGHTAIRLLDPGQQPVLDLTFNYGTFAFGPGFYGRFLRGHLDYRLSVQGFSDFQTEYITSSRGLIEQPLDLAPEDVQAVADFLAWNALPENRVYRYGFFGDNCSSRVLAVLAEVFGERWDAGCAADPGQSVSYRAAIAPYIAGLGWVRTGIEFALGALSDRPMGPCGSSFLPDGLMAQIQLAQLDGHPIAGAGEELVPPERGWFAAHPAPPITPDVAFAVLLVLTAIGVWRGNKWLSRAVLGVAAFLGVLLVLMWALTDHRDTWWNPDLAWASPLLFGLFLPGGWASARGRNLRRVIVVSGFLIGCAAALFGCAFHGAFWWMSAAVFLALEPWTLWPDRSKSARSERTK